MDTNMKKTNSTLASLVAIPWNPCNDCIASLAWTIISFSFSFPYHSQKKKLENFEVHQKQLQQNFNVIMWGETT
jgi:hypothetical protein